MDDALSPIVFSDSYRIGIDSVDDEHGFLIGLYNDLVAKIEGGDAAAALDSAVIALFGYADYHFGNEEKVMAALGFPEAESHRRQHEGFIRALKEFDGDRHGGDVVALRALAWFVGRWIRGHILVSDKEIGEFAGTRIGNAYFSAHAESLR